MDVSGAFEKYQDYVDADPNSVKEANGRALSFKSAFSTLDDVDDVFTSGSLARKTHKAPIHDVDVVIVYKQADYPGWGRDGTSAKEALDYTREKVNGLLGATHGSHERLMRLHR
jgi:hypothetical protein